MTLIKKKAYINDGCVACGNCVKSCRLKAVSVHKGMYAVVNRELCVGCGKCAAACPAGIIGIIREERAV